MKYSRFMFAGALGAAFTPATNPALAADAIATTYNPPAPSYADNDFSKRWDGIYVGVNAGLISHQPDYTGFFPSGYDESYAWPDQGGVANGALIGGTVGYNYQTGNWVVGAEADLGYSTADKMDVFNGDYVWRQQNKIEALGTARLRVGYSFDDRVMIFATGGLAFGKVSNGIQAWNDGNPNDPYSWSDSEGWKLGYALGAGAEVALNEKWSIKGEGLFYDLGSESHVSDYDDGDTYAWGADVKSRGFIGRVGLNYKF